MKNIVFDKTQYELICGAEKKLLHKVMNNLFTVNYNSNDIEVNNLYTYVKGNLPVCLVAHIDLVMHPAYEYFYCEKDNVVFSLSGADDDRNGVYGIVEVLKVGYKPDILLLDEEESGGFGALEFIKNHPAYPNKIKFFLELDRQGHNDMVTYQYANPAFDKAICQYGFRKAIGTFSDIYYLSPYYGIGAANLSIGYVGEHTTGCHTYINSMMATIKKVCKILDDIDNFHYFRWLKSLQKMKKAEIDNYIIEMKTKINTYGNYTHLYGHRYPKSQEQWNEECYPIEDDEYGLSYVPYGDF